MCGIRDPDGYVYSPTIFLINADNDVVLAQKGNSGGIEAIVRAFLENPDAPEQPAQEDFGEFTAMGVCGNDAVWHFYEDGTLRISGEGALWENTYQSFCTSLGWTDDYLTEEYSSAAENIRADAVKKIIVDSKITGMGMGIFHQLTNLESITFRGAPPQGIDGYIGISDQITVYFPDNETGWAGIDKSRFPDGTKWISLDAAGTHHHKWGAWKTTKAATVYEEGKKQRSCTECGKTQSAVIEKREPVSIENAKVSFPASIVYNGKKQEPSITVKVGSVTLKAGSDYTAVYSGNTNAGTDTAKVTITGKEKYKGTIEKKFSIAKANQELTVTASKVAVGKNVTISVKGAKGTKTFKTADKAITTVTSKGVVTGRKVGSVKITVTSRAAANFNAASKTVTVKVLPAATAKITTTNLATGIKVTWKKVAGANGYLLYRNGTKIATLSGNANVTYTDKNANTNGAKYTYKVVAKASTGTSTLSKSLATYKVARPAVSSVTNSASKKMTVKWGKNAKATGYQIQYSTGKTFPSGSKTVTVKGAANVSKAIGSLTKGKTYYVRIRTYKTAGGRNYWSVWSAAKSVKITK